LEKVNIFTAIFFNRGRRQGCGAGTQISGSGSNVEKFLAPVPAP